MSNHIFTYSKNKFYPLEPIKDDININDIVHALSLMVRANGHIKYFYSVAQHSINCFKEAENRNYSKRVQLGCLLHDASESYIADIIRPVKRQMPEYCAVEKKLQSAIYECFGLGDLSINEQNQIKDIDDTILYYEFKALMDIDIIDTAPYISMEHDFSQGEFASVEKEFLTIFNELTAYLYNENPI